MYTLSRIPKCILQVISKITLNLLYRLTKGKLLTKCYSAKPILQTWLYLNCSTDLTLMEVPKRCTPLGVYKSLIKSYKRLILKENIYGHRHSGNILDIRLGTRYSILMTLLLLVHSSLMAAVSHWGETLGVYDPLDMNEMKRMLSFHSFLHEVADCTLGLCHRPSGNFVNDGDCVRILLAFRHLTGRLGGC